MFLVASCNKEPLYEAALEEEIVPNSQVANRNIAADTLIRTEPEFYTVRALANLIESNTTSEQYMEVVEYYGEIHWGEAHTIGFAEDTSSYIISVPLIKDEKVRAVVLNIKEDGVQHVLLREAEILEADVADLLNTYELWELVLLASSLSNHQYFYNGEVSFFQSKLKAINEVIAIAPRCVYWEEVCDFIYFDNNPNTGYIDCYYVAHYGGCGGGGIPTFEFGLNVPTSTTGGGEGPGDNSDNNEDIDNTEINWAPNENCEFLLAPHLAAQINNLSLLFPCQSATADQIVGNIMQNLCNNTGPNEFISMLDFEEALSNYAFVDMSLFWSDPEEFAAEFMEAVCSCPGQTAYECIEEDDAPPVLGNWVSCKSFDFNHYSVNPDGALMRRSSIKLDLIWKQGTSIVKKVPVAIEFSIPTDFDTDLAAFCASEAINYGADGLYDFFDGQVPPVGDDTIRLAFEAIVSANVVGSGCQDFMDVNQVDFLDPNIPGPEYIRTIFLYHWECAY